MLKLRMMDTFYIRNVNKTEVPKILKLFVRTLKQRSPVISTFRMCTKECFWQFSHPKLILKLSFELKTPL